MNILVGERRQGKTSHLIKMSAAGEGIIVVSSKQSADYIKSQAKEMGLDIPEPTTWTEVLCRGTNRKDSYLLDELSGILMRLGIKTATLDDECNIEYLNGDPLHYGDELAAKIRETMEEYSKLSDFDKFVLDSGYRYEIR